MRTKTDIYYTPEEWGKLWTYLDTSRDKSWTIIRASLNKYQRPAWYATIRSGATDATRYGDQAMIIKTRVNVWARRVLAAIQPHGHEPPEPFAANLAKMIVEIADCSPAGIYVERRRNVLPPGNNLLRNWKCDHYKYCIWCRFRALVPISKQIMNHRGKLYFTQGTLSPEDEVALKGRTPVPKMLLRHLHGLVGNHKVWYSIHRNIYEYTMGITPPLQINIISTKKLPEYLGIPRVVFSKSSLVREPAVVPGMLYSFPVGLWTNPSLITDLARVYQLERNKVNLYSLNTSDDCKYKQSQDLDSDWATQFHVPLILPP